MNKTIFLDRDGTVIVDKHYLFNPKEVELEAGAASGLAKLYRAGFQLIGVTNQSGIGRGLFSLEDAIACNEEVDRLLSLHGVRMTGWFICPHMPSSGCACRKPKPGLLDQADRDFNVDWSSSYVIGDKDTDILLATEVGITGLLVRTGSGKQYEPWAGRNNFSVFSDLDEIANHIVKV